MYGGCNMQKNEKSYINKNSYIDKLINQCFLGFYLPITRARYSVAFAYKAKKLPQNVWNIKEWKP